MIYKTFFVDKTFEAGVEIGSLRAHLAGQGSGELVIEKDYGDCVEVRIGVYNPLVMTYAQERIANFV